MTVEVITFGCRLNAAESATMQRHAEAAGLTDTILVNSCAVTSEAVAQARQSIRRRKRERPHARIVVTGCAAQIDPKMFGDMRQVDRVVGNDDKLHAQAWFATREAFDEPSSQKIAVSDIFGATTLAPQHVTRAQRGLPRGFVQIQNGCDHRCTFCIIPYGRGNSRSLPPQQVIAQVRALHEAGHAEIVLTGVDLTAYDAEGLSLGALAKRVLREVPELKRLRISSIDAVEADDNLLDLVSNETRLMPHLHLSLQSGDDLILKRMKRRHSRADAIALCVTLRDLRPDIAIGADIIAGFPTETEEMFARSLDLVEECGLTFLHVFPFSPRPGTPAARMPQVAGDGVRDRAKRLRTVGQAVLRKRLDAEIGFTRSVLIESATQGRTEHFLPVAISGDTPSAVRVLTITGNDGVKLRVAPPLSFRDSP